MTKRLSLMEYIKVMLRLGNSDQDLIDDGRRNQEVEALTPSMPMELRQNVLPGARAIKSGATFIAPVVASRGRRLWSANQEGSWYIEHTRSNLG